MPVDVKAIEARLLAATTLGAWSRTGVVRIGDVVHAVGPAHITEDAARADAELMRHAPTDLAALLAENAALREAADECDRLRAELDAANRPLAALAPGGEQESQRPTPQGEET